MCLALAVSFNANAQYDVSFAHYWDLLPYYNPAAAGKQECINIAGTYAHSLTGFENNPKTMYVAGDLPFFFAKNYHGVGAQLLNDQIGLFTHQRIALQYAFIKPLFGGSLSMGIQIGFINEAFKGTDLDLETSGDPAFSTSDINGNALDLAAGLLYQRRCRGGVVGSWYVGASVQHANSPLIELGTTNEIQVDMAYYFMGGCNIKTRNPLLSIHPSLLVMSDGVETRTNVTGRLVYTHDEKQMYGGLTYSPSNSVTVLLGGKFHDVNVGYSYEIYTSGISISNGSHELFASYQMPLNLVKKGRNKHKSVRYL